MMGDNEITERCEKPYDFERAARIEAAAREAVKVMVKSKLLGNYSVLSEERSGSHSHGPKKAAEYWKKYQSLLAEVNQSIAALRAALEEKP
jgi:hypothetical protein